MYNNGIVHILSVKNKVCFKDFNIKHVKKERKTLDLFAYKIKIIIINPF